MRSIKEFRRNILMININIKQLLHKHNIRDFHVLLLILSFDN